MSTCHATFLLLLLLLLLLHLLAIANVVTCRPEEELGVIQTTHAGFMQAMEWAHGHEASLSVHGLINRQVRGSSSGTGDCLAAWRDCVKLYEEAESRIARLVVGDDGYSGDDAVTWLSGAAAGHRSCLEGLEEKGVVVEGDGRAKNLTVVLREALEFYGTKLRGRGGQPKGKGARNRTNFNQNTGLLTSWDAATSKADIVVAEDGSGNYRTINEAVAALGKTARNQQGRTIIHVKAGVYNEKVEIQRDMKNFVFIGDGIDRTIVTGHRNVQDGDTTINSATFGVSGDGFWARDMTFENTAGPHKHQAVALRVGSDFSVFYHCSFKGYQDTLLVHSLRQFYRDCHIYGTVDFIFGDAAAIFQNCDIFVRRPMDHQANMVTAQGRDDPNENTGISIINSRVRPAPEFSPVKGRFRSYLGRPWKKYSRTVVLKTDLDGLIDPRGWTEWSGDFALSTLYYGEYLNSGGGAATGNRVRWPGYHVLHYPGEASPFTVRNFIQGESWLPASGVPFSSEV